MPRRYVPARRGAVSAGNRWQLVRAWHASRDISLGGEPPVDSVFLNLLYCSIPFCMKRGERGSHPTNNNGDGSLFANDGVVLFER